MIFGIFKDDIFKLLRVLYYTKNVSRRENNSDFLNKNTLLKVNYSLVDNCLDNFDKLFKGLPNCWVIWFRKLYKNNRFMIMGLDLKDKVMISQTIL